MSAKKSIILNFQHFNSLDNGILGSFQNLPPNNKFIQNAINLIKIKDNIQLANITKILIQRLNQQVNKLDSQKRTSKCSN